MTMEQFKKWLKTDQPVKNKQNKKANNGYYCHLCDTLFKEANEELGCPDCDEDEEDEFKEDEEKEASALISLAKLRTLIG